MNQGNAQYVENNSQQTGIPEKCAVQKSAPLCYVGITSIRNAGKQPVYNMEVDDHHNFSVNGGVIVHNCMDSIRYLANTIMWRE